MRTFLLLILILLFSSNPFKAQNTYFNAMHEINAKWKYNPEHCPTEFVQFKTDLHAIQAHLLLVCEALIKQTPNDLSNGQRNNRLQLIATLRDYAQEKIFPTNLYHSVRTPYFVDDFGVHCAVGYLMHSSGYDNLVNEIRQNENYKYIEEIETKGVGEWATKHGFTLDELKWIQPAYIPSGQNLSNVGNGTNGHITKIRRNTSSGGLIIAGDFDTLDLIPCLNIGIYRNNEFSCFGDGLQGEITDVRMLMGNVVVFGALEHDNKIYPIAEWNGETWEYIEIPEREGAKATAGFANLGYYASITHPEDSNKQEIWIRENLNAPWKKVLEINGFLTSIEASVLGRVFAGSFNEAYKLDDNGAHTDTLICNNVIFRNHNNNHNWEPITGNEICDTVKSVFVIQSQIYFGGTAIKNNPNSSGIVLSRFLNNSLQPILLASNFSNDTVAINAISMSTTTSNLILGGNFTFSPMVGTFGRNLANYDIILHNIQMLALLDGPVNTISQMGQETLFIGGAFNNNLTIQQLNHLARFGTHLGINEEGKPAINTFPNPFSDNITIDGLPSICPYKIVDLQGRTIQSGNLKNKEAIDLGNLNSGTYLLLIEYKGGMTSIPIVKQ